MDRLMIALLVSAGITLAVASRLPGTLSMRDDDYAVARTVIDVRRAIADHYIDAVEGESLRRRAVDGLLSDLDAYAAYIPPGPERERFDRLLDGDFVGVGVQLELDAEGRVTVLSPIANSPAHRSGVVAGDIIVAVDGRAVAGSKLEDVVSLVGGPEGTEVTLTLLRGTGPVAGGDAPRTLDVALTRRRIVVPVVKGLRYVTAPPQTQMEFPGTSQGVTWDYWLDPDAKLAYVRLTQFTPNVAETLRDVLRTLLNDGLHGLILDLRFNPGGQLEEARRVADLFLREGVIVITRGRMRPELVSRARPAGTLPEFPLVLLVNGASASAAEVVAGALLDNRRAILVGERTFGKGSVQEVLPLSPDVGALKLTVSHYFTPSGRRVQRLPDDDDGVWGVSPQIAVPLTQEDLIAAMRARLGADRIRPDDETEPGDRTITTAADGTRDVLIGGDPQLRRAAEVLIGLIAARNVPHLPPTGGAP